MIQGGQSASGIAAAVQGKTMRIHSKSQLALTVIGFVALAGGIGGTRLCLADETGSRIKGELTAKIDEHLTNLAGSGDFSGSVAVTLRGKTVLSKGYGLANREFEIAATGQTKYRIASITK